MTVPLTPAVPERRNGGPSRSPTSLPSLHRSSTPPFIRFTDGQAAPPTPPTSSTPAGLEIRLFYVRVSPCASDAVPPFLTLSYLRREMGASLEINGARIPASETANVTFRRDRVDRSAAEAIYVSTDGVRLTGAVDFEVCDDQGNLVLCGSLERMDTPWSNGAIGFDHHQGQSCDKDSRTGWSMGCYLAASAFVPPAKSAISSTPSVELYIAGCSAGVPLILTKTLLLSPRGRVIRLGGLDSIPEDEETTGGEADKKDKLVLPMLTSFSAVAEEESNEYDPNMPVRYSYHPEGWQFEEAGQLSWFNAGVRVGLGIGLGMCVGIGVGVGLLMKSYQATTRSFKRRFF